MHPVWGSGLAVASSSGPGQRPEQPLCGSTVVAMPWMVGSTAVSEPIPVLRIVHWTRSSKVALLGVTFEMEPSLWPTIGAGIPGRWLLVAEDPGSAVVPDHRVLGHASSGEGLLRRRLGGMVAALGRGVRRQRVVGWAVPARSLVGLGQAGQGRADAGYHSSHIELLPTGATPLRSGFVENIHVNGPEIFAREVYVLNGAQPKTTYQVTLNVFVLDPSCTGEPLVVPTAAITTNAAGNGQGGAVFHPADVPAVLRNATHGIIWTVSDASGVVFSSGCEVVTID
jgi:hypothetical protein